MGATAGDVTTIRRGIDVPWSADLAGGETDVTPDPFLERHEGLHIGLTPTNASWAKPDRDSFGPLRTFVMGDSNHPTNS
ncbi:hypothetical protein [Rhodococcus wratislaviensis]|uniref:Uncharacterized protein n=1 Tax=Rhodococcus wratislaviensis NBRC 100605 TaxID=1219028 RepID=X0PM49_RHOWR|nr:hypothetical protein [Rhodococcus wratislaviensis]GAF43599.1 hypothetical protein RW1_009_00230 [Rhodococcus wratislaviensis NBRC 100605]